MNTVSIHRDPLAGYYWQCDVIVSNDFYESAEAAAAAARLDSYIVRPFQLYYWERDSAGRLMSIPGEIIEA